jgi:hypothetical protein
MMYNAKVRNTITPTLTLGAGWVQQFVSGLVLLNTLLGHPTAATTLRTPDSEELLRTLNEIAGGHYDPRRHFQEGRAAQSAFVLQAPVLISSQVYVVITLNASTSASDFVSVKTGGIVFEDPAWAVFAAYAIARGTGLGAPLAADNQRLWHQLSTLSAAAAESRYSPRDFFGPVTGFVDPSVGPEFHLLEVTGSQLAVLRERGLQSFGTPTPRFYILFQEPPH